MYVRIDSFTALALQSWEIKKDPEDPECFSKFSLVLFINLKFIQKSTENIFYRKHSSQTLCFFFFFSNSCLEARAIFNRIVLIKGLHQMKELQNTDKCQRR